METIEKEGSSLFLINLTSFFDRGNAHIILTIFMIYRFGTGVSSQITGKHLSLAIISFEDYSLI